MITEVVKDKEFIITGKVQVYNEGFMTHFDIVSEEMDFSHFIHMFGLDNKKVKITLEVLPEEENKD